MKKIVSAEMYKVRHNLSFFVSMIASVPLGALFTIVMWPRTGGNHAGYYQRRCILL